MPTNIEVIDRINYENDQIANSYRLESQNPFSAESVEKILETWMNNILENASYDANESPRLCAQIATEIRNRVEMLEFDRYKIVVVVTIVEKENQGITSSMACVWDSQRDNYAKYVLETLTFIAYCCVYGVYCE
ncbi:dynein light chain Tctex-type 5-like isoform X1 [Leptopilina boulardi]|uniref:dynein light chain Tctex-type 5-like isoform X1 n=1 Tax=Leptopilina boulardi TaxID=63433 RepID=UPI0021F68307|nr:dynein light chain Tctex-type 5-like isoform X1 [Leptopilina boulardi]